MPNGFLINDGLSPEIRSKVERRLMTFGFHLQDWPRDSIAGAGKNDVAIYVIDGPSCSPAEVQRFSEAVRCGVPIISIFLDGLAAQPSLVGDYSSQTVTLDSERLADVLNQSEELNEAPSGEAAEKTKIKHNKC